MCCYKSRFYSEDTDVSQGSVVTHFRCGGIYSNSFIAKCLLILTVKKNLKMDQYLVKL